LRLLFIHRLTVRVKDAFQGADHFRLSPLNQDRDSHKLKAWLSGEPAHLKSFLLHRWKFWGRIVLVCLDHSPWLRLNQNRDKRRLKEKMCRMIRQVGRENLREDKAAWETKWMEREREVQGGHLRKDQRAGEMRDEKG
jgi:hypothetical protein